MSGGIPALRRSSGGALVCDMDGVLYLEERGIPGAGEAVDRVRRSGWRVVFATNNATRTPSDLVRSLADRTGIRADESEIVSSAQAIATRIHEGPVLVVGEQGLREAVGERGLAVTDDPLAAAAVVVGLDRQFDYVKLAAATTAISRGARFFAANHDPAFPTPDGPMPGGGSLAAAIAAASGVTPVYGGKPHRPMRALVAERLGNADPVWVVGDRPDTDIALGREAGWRTVLVLSGIVSDPDDIPAEFMPDAVVGSIADVPGLIGI